jgi:hypothetical protein
VKTLVYASFFALAAACASSGESPGEASGGATAGEAKLERDRWDSRPGSREVEETN